MKISDEFPDKASALLLSILFNFDNITKLLLKFDNIDINFNFKMNTGNLVMDYNIPSILISNKKKEILKLFLEHKNYDINQAADELILAVNSEDENIIELLLDNGHNPNKISSVFNLSK